MAVVDRLRGEVAYRRARAHLEHEQRDICDTPPNVATGPGQPWSVVAGAPVGDRVIGGGLVLKEIPGMGKVYDWRSSTWTPANGGRINPLVFVQHIPVVPNTTGIADFVTLRNVLVAQGLMVQSATDREGNVALFTPFDVLCYQAKGANQFSCGCEHMHVSTGELWSRMQLRAAGWLVQLAERKHGIPLGMANLNDGDGVVRVARRGQTSHKNVSARAGYNDRTDPGGGYDWDYVKHCAVFFKEHGHMKGA